MVYSLIGSFPALRTLYLRDCYRQDEDFDEFQDHLQDDPDDASRNPYGSSEIISNSLRHIVCENVDPAFRRLWLSTPGVDIVEMHMCEFDPWDHPLYPFREIGVHRMLLRDPVFCGAVKRLHIENRLVDENVDDSELELVWLLDEAYDAKNIQSFFAWRAHVLPCLQELILEVPFYLEHIPDILAALPEICPNLRVFKIEMSLRGYQDFIDHGQNSLLPSSKEFQSLEEIRLPFTGLHCDLVTALPCFFLNAPRLAHVYLSNPRILDGQDPSQQALLTLATIEIGTGAGQQYKTSNAKVFTTASPRKTPPASSRRGNLRPRPFSPPASYTYTSSVPLLPLPSPSLPLLSPPSLSPPPSLPSSPSPPSPPPPPPLPPLPLLSPPSPLLSPPSPLLSLPPLPLLSSSPPPPLPPPSTAVDVPPYTSTRHTLSSPPVK
ncbi:hypothetical protein MSAN_01024300 [Mycena sanguinolenta]|uniref:Uncharacterized protein n=1 Tax=Mycena sanguinolenta TaxID=230812 RepID=A0A8H7D635_9AGAR|nr:hypothetical protein MSAN_01024300 [Mycena sanguinolenta]